MEGPIKIGSVSVNPGEKISSWLDVCDDFDGPVRVPLLAANGKQPGKRFYAVSGLYGDEYTGMEAIYELFRSLEPEKMAGQVLAVPMLNTPAFDLIKRTGPDEIILNRVGGGKSDGFLTEVLTKFFMSQIVENSDYGIEIIDIGMYYTITSFVALVQKPDGSVNMDYAKAFGSELLWKGSASPAVLRNASIQTGVDVFMTELGGEGRCRADHKDFELLGLKNLLKYLDIIPGRPENLPGRYRVYDGFWLHSRSGGIFRSDLTLRQEVKTGEILAVIHDLLDREIEIIRAPHDGIVIGYRTVPRIRPGDWTVWIGRILEENG